MCRGALLKQVNLCNVLITSNASCTVNWDVGLGASPSAAERFIVRGSSRRAATGRFGRPSRGPGEGAGVGAERASNGDSWGRASAQS